MTLRQIVRAKGGDLYASGNRASIPGPGHSKADRSASLLIGRNGRVIAHSFGRSTALEILDDLRDCGLVDIDGYPTTQTGGPSPSRPCLSTAGRVARASELWSQGIPLSGTLSERFLSLHRAIDLDVESLANLRHHPCCPVSVYALRPHLKRPALMARVEGRDGRIAAVELTYLDQAGQRDHRLALSRKTIGIVPAGACVPLLPFDETIVVAEGVMTALSAGSRFGLPAIALLGVRNMVTYRPPASVRKIIIAADRGKEGEAAGATLFQASIEYGLEASLELPREPFDDFNRWAQAEREKGEGGRVRAEIRNGS